MRLRDRVAGSVCLWTAVTGLALGGLVFVYSLGPIKIRTVSSGRSSSGTPPGWYPHSCNAFQSAPIDVWGSLIPSRLFLFPVRIMSAKAVDLEFMIEGTGVGVGTFHPAVIKNHCKVWANKAISGLPSWYCMIAVLGGAPLIAARNLSIGTPRGSCLFFTSTNCFSASAARSCCVARSLLNLRNCSAYFSFIPSPRMSAAEPETTVSAMSTIVAQSAIDFHVSADIENPFKKAVEKTRMLVGGLAFIWALIATVLGYKRVKQLHRRRRL